MPTHNAFAHAVAELRRIAGMFPAGRRDHDELHRISGLLEGVAEGLALADETRRAERESSWDDGYRNGWRDSAREKQGSEYRAANPWKAGQ